MAATVLDSYALLTLLRDEPGAGQVRCQPRRIRITLRRRLFCRASVQKTSQRSAPVIGTSGPVSLKGTVACMDRVEGDRSTEPRESRRSGLPVRGFERVLLIGRGRVPSAVPAGGYCVVPDPRRPDRWSRVGPTHGGISSHG